MYKQIKGASNYFVNDDGFVKSIDHIITKWNGYKMCNILYKGRIIKPKYIRGYANVCIVYDDGKRKTKQVHRLVLETFSPNPNMSELQVNHKDGIKDNNNLSNLEWVTPKENTQHAYKSGLAKPKEQSGEANKMAKLTENDVREILNIYKTEFKPYVEVAKLYNVSRGTIRNIIQGKTWTHINL